MNLNSVFLEEFRKSPFLGIARGLPPKQVSNCVEVCLKSNLKFIEVPLNTENAALALKNLCKEGKKKGLIVGAGTVITERNLQIAIDCEAKFIVSPGANPALVQKCAEKSIPCIPGALTPTEIMQAFMLGATAIKVFPVSSLGGEKYIKELRGPFKEIPLLACGGVKEDNLKAYFEAGSDFVSFGASVFNVSEMENGNWQDIEKKLTRLLSLAAPLSQQNKP
ncbi:MAG: bifunctional 4-hydroxy-2-oxoglutarate aldolase/2-dehydro-3-deoxy-phosphogluconate aldolase [Fibromonadaceae bacterium]|jgi:2-dehydro-3-deoxyphosphogluconate aldolase/(4S)-4-hydroxy-2-oxoglutarate aldolase|nr:bifunctional 4-hydroxy-2-oxoglutarate aldolase/2-dehydro-3-deoxy-phosphogluconate aldolase [Fibromonadaceae bacterium]